eukprot:COSAG02_NODE_981_length_15488_cov_27.585093_16_plen_85_part_00
MRLGQSAAAAAAPTRALPLATSTEIVVFHAAEKRSDDQWHRSMSRSSPASATHVLPGMYRAGDMIVLGAGKYLFVWDPIVDRKF